MILEIRIIRNLVSSSIIDAGNVKMVKSRARTAIHHVVITLKQGMTDMRFTVDFKCDSDAFNPDAIMETVNCLARIQDALLASCPTDLYQNVLDSNGNIVGTFRLATKGVFS